MPSPATLSKLLVTSLLGGLALLLVEIRFEHREALGEAWQSWIPLFYCGSMIALGALALARWHRGGRQALLAGFAGAFVIGLLGFWFHSKGHPVSGLLQVLRAWVLRPGDNGGVQAGAPPLLAPLSFVGLGSMGVIACALPDPSTPIQTMRIGVLMRKTTDPSTFEKRKAMNELFNRILGTANRSSAPLLLIRGVTSFVFLLEGILKFVSPDKLGVGRFVKIGIPFPQVVGPFVGVVEIACGLLIVFGLLTRVAAVPLIVDMLVAIATTKVPILIHSGPWDMAHEARLDLAMLASSCVLLAAGAGTHSIDAWLVRRRCQPVTSSSVAAAAKISARA